MLLIILIVLLILCLVPGVWGPPTWGYWGWSPLFVLLFVIVILFAFGALHV